MRPPPMTTLRAGLRACSVKLLGREADLATRRGRVETDAVRAGIDVGAGVLQDRLGLVVKDVDPDLLEHASAA